MKKYKINRVLMMSGLLSSIIVTGCNSGNSTPGTSSSATQVQFLPDGTAELADGTRIKLAENLLEMDTNHIVSTKVSVTGPTSLKQMGLITKVLSPLASAELTAQSTDVDKLQINSSSAAGYGQVELIATGLSGSPVVGVANVNINQGSMIKAAYIDMSASGAVSMIQSSGYKAANVLIFGFADTSSSSTNSSYLSTIQTAINSESAGTINLLSIGGATGTASSMTDTATVVSNIDAQIKAYNSSLSNGKIDGVDLDLEGGFTADQITAIAKGFSDKGYLVSAAPQIYLSTGTTVDSSNPSNLVLTSGSPYSNQSNYTPAIANGYINYIFVQTYNTPNWTIDGYAESQVGFFKAVAKALNNSTKSDCSAYASSTTSVCIPEATNLVVGTVANAGGAYSSANIFGVAPGASASSCGTSYNQSSILTQLKTSIDEMIADTTNYKYFDGVMMWSLNTDYDPKDYYDCYATTGGFSSMIYGAESSGGGSSSRYFILQISNTGDGTGSYPYATASLKVNGANYEFGGLSSTGKDIALAAGTNKSWGTKASSQDPTTSSYVTDSNNLDVFFANADSFTISGIQINKYSDENKTKAQYVQCNSTLKYTTLSAGHTYNVMVNPTYGSCEISQVN